jgi:Na+-translocating ferredoxin:NAD+ oxidoreductase subunit D
LEMSSWHIPQNIISGPLSIDNFPVPANIDQEFINPLNWESLKQSLQAAFPILITNSFDAGNLLDGMAMATPLMKFEMAGHSALLAALQSAAPVFARESGTAWEIINIAYLLGGLFLLYKRIISWHIPVSIIASVLFVSVLFYQAESAAIYGSPFLHLFGSATMLGAFFIATDPVSAATSRRGKIYYGIIIGISIYAIRVWGSYLDSIAFAVLFGNFCAPLLDHYCRPRIFGHPSNAVAKTTTYRKRPVK